MAAAKPKHRLRYERWKRRLRPISRQLADYVENILAPKLMSAGFVWTDYVHRDEALPVDANEINLEKAVDAACTDDVSITFARYGLPRFQVACSRWNQEARTIVRAASLVARPNEYYHYWGKPWFLPTSAWPPQNAERSVQFVSERIDQLLAFLGTGQTGPNIGRQIGIGHSHGQRGKARL